MVSYSRKENRPSPIRLINAPKSIKIQVNKHQRPILITYANKTSSIIKINEVWEINTEWWRPTAINRRYFRVSTKTNNDLTIFCDLTSNLWYRQKS